MSIIKKRISPFLALWLLVISISVCIAVVLAGPLGEFLHNLREVAPSATDDGDYEFLMSALFLVGLFMGFGQWIVIRNKIKITKSWIFATTIGFSIGGLVSFQFLYFLVQYDYNFYMFYGTILIGGTFIGAGIFMGFFQWLSLKRKLAGSFLWSLVNGLSFLIGLLPMLLPSYFMDISFFISIGLVALTNGYFVEKFVIRPEIEIFSQKENAI